MAEIKPYDVMETLPDLGSRRSRNEQDLKVRGDGDGVEHSPSC